MKLMHPVLTADAMRAADEYTIQEFGLSGFTLMESAGQGVSRSIERRVGPIRGKRVTVYCGKGNNGGDGFVVARELFERGAFVMVVLMGRSDSMSAEAAAHYRILENLAKQDDDGHLTLGLHDDGLHLPPADLHVDALLGTGLSSDLREPILSLVRKVNGMPGRKIAVDIPTGLHTERGLPLGEAFRADYTFTLAARKSGHLLNEGPTRCGRVEVIPIGIPAFALRNAAQSAEAGCAWMPTDEAIKTWLPSRGHDANKYSVGLALVIAGSVGMTGAPVMAAAAAARAGAGYVICACDRRIESSLAGKFTEVATVALPSDEHGLIPDAALSAIEGRLEKARGLLIGCGLGTAPGTQDFVRALLSQLDRPIVIDADGLTALVNHTERLAEQSEGRWILTPHMGEFRRLAGDALDDLAIDPDDRVSLAQHYARLWNCVLLLKGLPSIVAAPDGTAWISASGNAALATAGTGDVLAGLCAGFLAQGLPPERAAVAAMHVGGAASDRYAATRSPRSMQALDLVEELPALLKERFEDA